MVKTSNREAAPPRRPSIKESTPTPRSVAVASYSEPAISFSGGSSSGGSSSSSGESKPKETPYYPSSIGMFFPFGTASSASAASSKSPFDTLRPTESPIINKDGSSNNKSSTMDTKVTRDHIAPSAPQMNSSTGGSRSGPASGSEGAATKPFYYPGSASQVSSGNGERGSPREAVRETFAHQDVLDDASWDDYSKVVSYEDLPCVSSTDLLEQSTSSQPPRTAFRVNSVPLSTVLARIETFLKIQSITCDPKGLVRDKDGTLACVTRRHCQFAIMIWRLEGDNGEEADEAAHAATAADDDTSRPGALLIAIERRQGCCVELQRMRQALKLSIETGRFPSAVEGKAPSAGCHSMPSSHHSPMTIAPLIKELYERQQAHNEPTSAQSGSEPAPMPASHDSAHPPSLPLRGSGVRRRSSLDGISTCASLLASQCLYKQQLGLENLVAMTDPSRGVDLETAQDVTDALLLPHHTPDNHHGHVPTIPSNASSESDDDSEEEGDDELFKKLQQEFLSFFVSSEESFHDVTQSQAFSLTVSPAPAAPKTFPDLTESPLQRTIRHSLALEALCNALQVTKAACRCGTLMPGSDGNPTTNSTCAGPCLRAGAHLDLDSDFWRAVIPALLLDVTNARSRPHDAALSAKCLALLEDFHQHQTSGDAPSRPPSTSSSRHLDCLLCLDYVETLVPYLVQARSYGSRHHLLLEREANELIGRLQRQQQEGRRRQVPVRHNSRVLPSSTQLQSF